MKATGIVRPIDNLGRIAIPKELRKILGIKVKDTMEIYVDGNMVMLQKYTPSCIYCGSNDDVMESMGKKICKTCREKLVKEWMDSVS